ncbi:MAG: carboxylating nicotinate-nucleotide diphosphorylase, partial [Oscillospiraceae bacterium]
RSILSGERVALNLIQHMSGIATATHNAVESVKGTGTIIVDTRKTTPGLRVLEKYAVKAGGGNNHRFNLSDGVLIKDNHIVAAGGIAAAINAVRANAPHTLRVEIEAETLPQVKECLDAGAEIIMLDNMSIEQMAEAVKFIGGRAITEASGNMGERDLREVAETGVNYISIGALTHSVTALDISLKFTD